MNPLVRAARRVAGSTTAKSVLQRQVDRIARPEARIDQDKPDVWDGGPRAPETDAAAHSASAAGGIGAIIGTLAGGAASLKGLNELGRQLQSNGSWLDGVHRLSAQLSPDQLRTAAQDAVAALPESVRTDLQGRLARQAGRLPGGNASDLPGAVSGFLRESGGARQLLGLLASSKSPLPGGAALNLMTAMKDPSVREFAKSLINALVRANGRGTSG